MRHQKEYAPYIIKPEGMNIRGKIRQMIRKGGLEIREHGLVLLNQDILDSLYENLRSDIRYAIYKFLTIRKVEVGIVYGTNAFRRMIQICGEHLDPMLCAPGTIRREFGWRKPVNIGGKKNFFYYGNIIHRAKKPLELTRDLEIVRRLLGIPLRKFRKGKRKHLVI